MQPAHEKIGVVDAQWIVNRVIPSIGDQVCISVPFTLNSYAF